MEYVELTDTDRSTLERQRVLQLEGDHYKLELLIREETDEGEIARMLAQQANIERRIRVLRGVLLTTTDPDTATLQGS